MEKIFLLVIVLFLLSGISAANNETCTKVFNFIIEHYNPSEGRLDFTNEDFDLLQMQTTVLEEDLKNHIIYYEDLCGDDLPFLIYNNKWPGSDVKEEEPKTQSMKVGFSEFIDTLKGDSIYLVGGILAVIVLIWLVGKYG